MANVSADIEQLAASDDLIAYVGYGSLVNVDTHRTPSIGTVPIRLHGWRRQWCHRANGFPALLSGIEDAHSEIDALLVYDYATSLPSLDEREVFYDRLTVQPSQIKSQTELHDCPIYIYRATDLSPAKPSQNFLLQSYLDAVFQGHGKQFGEGAIDRFVETTDHWSLPMKRDREAPIYPRPVTVTTQEAEIFDQALESLIEKL